MATTAAPYSVLIVEDDPDIVVGLQDLLEHDGYAVTVAGTCASAIAHIGMQRFNAILLDLGLPDGDGLDVLKEAQRLDASLPVIIITAHIAEERTVGLLMKGAFAYLTKPYNRDELRQTLRRAIGVEELAGKVKRAEHLLTESEHRFQSLVESAADGIIVANGRGIILSWNGAASRLFGYASEEIIGQFLAVLMPARYREAHERGLARMETTGESHVIGSVVELHGLRKDGTEFPVELSLATWATASGRFYSGIVRDVSERKQREQKLKQLEHRQALILNQAGEGIYGIDVNGNTTFVNPRAASLLGYRVEDLLGCHMHDVLHHSRPDGTPYPAEECPIYAATHDGLVHRVVDEVFWRKDGTSFPVEYVSTPILEDSEVTGAVIVFRDVTERKQAERAVAESQQRFRQLAEHIKEVFWITDPTKNQMIYISPGYEEIWMRSCDSLYASPRSWLEAIHPEDQNRVRAAALAKQTLGTYDEQYRIVRTDGSVRWIWDRAFPVRDASGTVYRIVGLAEDITENKRVEAALADSERKYRVLFDDNPSMYFMVNAEGTVLSVNRIGASRLGYEVDELLGQSVFGVFYEPDREAVRRCLEQCLSTPGQTMSWNLRKVRKDGTMMWVRETAQAVHNDLQPPVVLIVCEDISAIKETEQALRRSQQLLQDIADNTTAVIYVKDTAGRYLLINRRFEQLFHLTTDQIVGHTDHEIFPRDTADAFRANDVEIMERNTPIEYEERVPQDDGLHTYISIKFPLCDQAGIPYAICGISTDITERKRSETALRTHEERLRLALTSTRVGIWNWDLQTDRLFWSSQVDQFIGMPVIPGHKTQAGLLALVHPDDRETMASAMRQVMEPSRTVVLFEHRSKKSDGGLLLCIWTGHIIRDHAGKALHVLGTVRVTTPLEDMHPDQRSQK